MTQHVAPLARSIARAAAAPPAAGPAAIASSPAIRLVGVLIGGAWLAAILLQATGQAAVLHHHALIEGEDGLAAPPPWLAIALFVAAWQLMTASMMLPASLRAVRTVASSTLVTRPMLALGGFLAAYALVWTAFGLAALGGDSALHRIVDATPWLEARPWLIEAGVLALAGAYQFAPIRRRALEACRHPGAARARELGPGTRTDARLGFASGTRHALDCVICSWALMLLMFAVGVANLAWMAVLAAVMTYEALGKHGSSFGGVIGFVLLALAALAVGGVSLAF